MKQSFGLIGGLAAAIVVVLALSLFTVDQRQYAVVQQLGEVKSVISEPGLNFKWPLIQNVRFFDRRILTMDSPEPERFITSEKKNVLVDSYVKWRIVDPKLYYISVGGDESRARTRLSQTGNAGRREEFGSARCMTWFPASGTRSWTTCGKRPTRMPARSACRSWTCV